MKIIINLRNSLLASLITLLILKFTPETALCDDFPLNYTFTSNQGGIGSNVAVLEDRNSDGILEILSGAPSPTAGQYGIFSGSNGLNIFLSTPGGGSDTNFTSTIKSIPDISGDGKKDILAGGRGPGGGNCTTPSNSVTNKGQVKIFSGTTGNVLANLRSGTTSNYDEGFGASLDYLASINNDSTPDIIIGAHDEYHSGCNGNRGVVRIYSGTNFSIIREHKIHGSGWPVAGLDDLNNDGKPEYATQVSSYYTQIHSGADGALLYSIAPVDGDLYPVLQIVKFIDINNDGISEIILANPKTTNKGIVRIISGADGSEIYRIEGDAVNDTFGVSIAITSDIDGDSILDYAVGAPASTYSNDLIRRKGYVKIFSGVNGDSIAKIELPGATPYPQYTDWFGSAVGFGENFWGLGEHALLVTRLGQIYVYGIGANIPSSGNKCNYKLIKNAIVCL